MTQALPDGSPGARLRRLQASLRSTGGLVAARRVVDLLDAEPADSSWLLARWIADRRIVALPWCGEPLIPIFQIDFLVGRVRPEVRQVLAEFSNVFDDWEIAEWFAAPNLWLADAPPAEMLSRDPYGVVGAARADRYIAMG